MVLIGLLAAEQGLRRTVCNRLPQVGLRRRVGFVMWGDGVGMTCLMLYFCDWSYCPPDDWWMWLLLRYVGREGAVVCHEEGIRGSYGCIGINTVVVNSISWMPGNTGAISGFWSKGWSVSGGCDVWLH